jgi:hypothetical protein
LILLSRHDTGFEAVHPAGMIDDLRILRKTGNYQAEHHLGMLFLKRACHSNNYGAALEDAARSEEILKREIALRGMEDSYPYGALIVHKLRFLERWLPDGYQTQIDELYQLAKEALTRHPLDEQIKESHDAVYREYLLRAVKH